MAQVTPASAPLQKHLAKILQGTSRRTSRLHSGCPALAIAHNHNKHGHHQPREPFAFLEANSPPQHTANARCVSVYVRKRVYYGARRYAQPSWERGVAGRKLVTTEVPRYMWAVSPCPTSSSPWSQGQRDGDLILAMVCGRGMAWEWVGLETVWCSSKATFQMIKSQFTFIYSFFPVGSITDWERHRWTDVELHNRSACLTVVGNMFIMLRSYLVGCEQAIHAIIISCSSCFN